MAVIATAVVAMLALEAYVRGAGFEHSPTFATEPQVKLQRAKAASNDGGINVLIFGASDIDAGITPSKLDESSGGATRSFNAALAGLLPENYLLWESTLADSGVAGSRVVLSFPVLMFLPETAEVSAVRATHSNAVAAGIRDSRQQTAGAVALLDRVSVAFDNRARLGQLDSIAAGSWYDPLGGHTAEREADQLGIGIDLHGWNQRYAEPGKPEELKAAAADSLEEPRGGSSTANLDGVQQLVRRFEDSGIKVAALIPPGSVAESADPSAYKMARRSLVSALRASGVPVIDAYEGFNADDYHDRDHLNRSGAEKLARLIGQTIAKACDADSWSWCNT